MRSYIRKISHLIAAIIVVAGLLTISSAEESEAEKPNENSKCYVCHPGMKTEAISTIHVAMGISCDVCHGASTEHMHDEMLMTEPDLLFGRAEVQKMCSNSSCHKPGGDREVYGRQDHMNPAAVEAFFEKWTGRMRPNGRAVTHDSVCTDCHGTHNISKPLDTKSGDEQQVEWIAAFNGKDLKGWKTSDENNWKVKSGRIVGAAGASDKGSTLWSETIYENYLLAITFRATWPVHAGIWLRGTESKSGPRIEIFDSSPAYTGSVLIPGKGLALTNIREDLEDRESWNTISTRIEGDKVQVWLNGEEIGSVRGIGPEKGKIGLYIEKHPASKSAEFCVREVLIQKLAQAEEK
ncbi:MAG: 3-keto-disaccharide hydrolase [Planctomycetota bacterium]